MPLRTLVELLHVAAGVAATALIVALTAWGYPLGTRTIWIVGVVAAVIVVAMGVGPVRRAWAADHVDQADGAERG